MNMQRIDLMGPEYVVMLGVWWSVTVILTIFFLAIKRALVRSYEHRIAGRLAQTAPINE